MSEDDAFFHWFAGFTDGEGSFSITRRVERGKNRYGYTCSFQLRLRADDYKILVEVRNKVGVGNIYADRDHSRLNPTVVYAVSAREDCRVLVDIFDKYPLRAKKASDFAIWRLAVLACCSRDIHGGLKQSNPALWADVAQLAEALTTIRLYREYDEIDNVLATTKSSRVRISKAIPGIVLDI
jgi:hypothetical protein